MARRQAGLALAGVLLASAVLTGTATPASADAPVRQGWWTAATPPAPAAGLPAAPATVPSDVPSDGLLVQGGSDTNSPVAYAAVAYDLGAGTAPGTFTLTEAPAPAVSTPVAALQLCPLESDVFDEEHGGAMADSPAYDCSRKAVGELDGATWTFDVGGLEVDGTLAFAILPADPTTRVVFSRPGEKSLTTSAKPTPSPTTGSTPSPVPTPTTSPVELTPGPTTDAPPPTPRPTDVPLGGTDDLGTVAGGGADGTPIAPGSVTPLQPSDGGTSSPPASTPVLSDPAVVAVPASVVTATAGSSRVAVGLVLVALLSASGLWLVCGRRSEGVAGVPDPEA